MGDIETLFLTRLRDENNSRRDFRRAADSLARLLALQALAALEQESVEVLSPLGAAEGAKVKHSVILVPILRSGLAMVDPFRSVFPDSKVGFVGIKRDEMTAQPIHYYQNIPSISSDDRVLILDPMLATGGTAIETVGIIKEMGVEEKRILFLGMICATKGRERVQKAFPEINLIIAAEDPLLNSRQFIVPGLGDFGDRYFGTEG